MELSGHAATVWQCHAARACLPSTLPATALIIWASNTLYGAKSPGQIIPANLPVWRPRGPGGLLGGEKQEKRWYGQ